MRSHEQLIENGLRSSLMHTANFLNAGVQRLRDELENQKTWSFIDEGHNVWVAQGSQHCELGTEVALASRREECVECVLLRLIAQTADASSSSAERALGVVPATAVYAGKATCRERKAQLVQRHVAVALCDERETTHGLRSLPDKAFVRSTRFHADRGAARPAKPLWLLVRHDGNVALHGLPASNKCGS